MKEIGGIPSFISRKTTSTSQEDRLLQITSCIGVPIKMRRVTWSYNLLVAFKMC